MKIFRNFVHAEKNAVNFKIQDFESIGKTIYEKNFFSGFDAVFINSRQFYVDAKYFGTEKGKADDRAVG